MNGFKYSEIKQEIETGDLLAWRIEKMDNIFHLILMAYQKIFKVKFSHVGIALKLDGRLFIVEASPPVVRIYPVTLSNDFYFIKVPIENRGRYISILFRHIGKRYSLLDMVKSMLRFRFNDRSLYCAELTYDFYKDIGLISDKEDIYTPDHIVEKIREISDSELKYVKIDVANIR